MRDSAEPPILSRAIESVFSRRSGIGCRFFRNGLADAGIAVPASWTETGAGLAGTGFTGAWRGTSFATLAGDSGREEVAAGTINAVIPVVVAGSTRTEGAKLSAMPIASIGALHRGLYILKIAIFAFLADPDRFRTFRVRPVQRAGPGRYLPC